MESLGFTSMNLFLLKFLEYRYKNEFLRLGDPLDDRFTEQRKYTNLGNKKKNATDLWAKQVDADQAP